jgi:hypothetical protein
MEQNDGRSVNTRFLPKQRLDLNVRLIEGEAVVLDRDGGLVHQLNQTATFIWNHCHGQMTLEDIVEELTRVYDVDAQRATRDTIEAIRKFEELDLLAS